MKTLEQRGEIFYRSVTPSNTCSASEQFKIWEDGYRAGYIEGAEDIRKFYNTPGSRASAWNNDVQNAYEQGYEDATAFFLSTNREIN